MVPSPEEKYASILKKLSVVFTKQDRRHAGFPFSFSNSLYYRSFNRNQFYTLFTQVLGVAQSLFPEDGVAEYIRFFQDHPDFEKRAPQQSNDAPHGTALAVLQNLIREERRAVQGFPLTATNASYFRQFSAGAFLRLMTLLDVASDDIPMAAVDEYIDNGLPSAPTDTQLSSAPTNNGGSSRFSYSSGSSISTARSSVLIFSALSGSSEGSPTGVGTSQGVLNDFEVDVPQDTIEENWNSPLGLEDTNRPIVPTIIAVTHHSGSPDARNSSCPRFETFAASPAPHPSPSEIIPSSAGPANDPTSPTIGSVTRHSSVVRRAGRIPRAPAAAGHGNYRSGLASYPQPPYFTTNPAEAYPSTSENIPSAASPTNDPTSPTIGSGTQDSVPTIARSAIFPTNYHSGPTSHAVNSTSGSGTDSSSGLITSTSGEIIPGSGTSTVSSAGRPPSGRGARNATGGTNIPRPGTAAAQSSGESPTNVSKSGATFTPKPPPSNT